MSKDGGWIRMCRQKKRLAFKYIKYKVPLA